MCLLASVFSCPWNRSAFSIWGWPNTVHLLFYFFLSSFLLARRHIKICDDNVNIASILSQLKLSHFLRSLDSWAVISQSCENENISITDAKFPLQEGSTFNTF